MISNLKGRLFFILGLLFFCILISREFKSSWIPDSIKLIAVEYQITNFNEEIENNLDSYKSNFAKYPTEDFIHLDFDFPLFIYKNGDLVYWNSYELKPPDALYSSKEGIHFMDYGFSKTLNIVRKPNDSITFIGVNLLWKDVGIENAWINKGSNDKYFYNWKLGTEEGQSHSLEINEELDLSIIFNEKAKNTSEGSLFLIVVLGLLFFAFAFIQLEKELLNIENPKSIIYFSISAIALVIIYEYSRRFINDSEKASLFFVVYPFILSFLFGLFIIGFNRLKEGLKEFKLQNILNFILIFTVYVFSKSYWKEIFDKEYFDLNLINFVRLESNTLFAFIGVFGMSLFFFLCSKFLLTKLKKSESFELKYPALSIVALTILMFILDIILEMEWYFGYFLIGIVCFIFYKWSDTLKERIEVFKLSFFVISIVLITLLITETTLWGSFRKEYKLLKRFENTEWRKDQVTAEELLSTAIAKIKDDKLTYLAFKNPIISKDIVVQKIKRVYLDSYFDPFEVKIDFLDSKGENLNPQLGYQNLYFFKSNFFKKRNEVNDNLYVNMEDGSKTLNFYAHVDINEEGNTLGHIVLEIYKDKTSINSIFPKLLVDQKYSDEIFNSNYKHKSISKNDIIEFAQEMKVKSSSLSSIPVGSSIFLESKQSYFLINRNEKSFEIGIKDKSKTTNLISHYSIIFLVLSILSLLVYLIISPIKILNFENLPFRFKIQFFMNLAFLLPLIFVSLTVLKFMNDNEKETIVSNYIEKVKLISKDIEIPFLDYQNQIIPRRIFQERASKAAGNFSLDYFIYNTKGELQNSSKDIVWERGIENRLIDYRALNELSNSRTEYVINNSSIGEFQYKTAYASLHDLNNKHIGILGVPFYESTEDLESRFIQLLSTVINVFVLTFIVFLFLSNRLTDRLMVPVLRLSDKIKLTSFQNENKPLEWSSTDEIGLLVKSYNEMIEKLNESRIALSKTEKEAAWKEMAQQVAHEIKNPLTPMKLRLQQLIRQQDGTIDQKKLNPILESLLHQVENLSEIASSFSEFARMPNPKNEIINLGEVVELASNIYKGKVNVNLELNIADENLIVNADKSMMSRSIGNIILNGIQSVEESEFAIIEISLFRDGQNAIIYIQDNGEGVSEELKDRIFIPHFSTKSGGTGIGLALAKKTVEGANGEIYFESAESKGTRFIIKLPLNN